jgi:RNA recognition motif-containing protein
LRPWHLPPHIFLFYFYFYVSLGQKKEFGKLSFTLTHKTYAMPKTRAPSPSASSGADDIQVKVPKIKKSKADKSEKSNKEKKIKKTKAETDHDNDEQGEEKDSKKRKRATINPEDEIEVDVTAPEPPSKKAMRDAKKAAKREQQDPEAFAAAAAAKQAEADGDKKRSDYGIWIGNLAFAVDKDMLRVFFTRQAQIPEADITRLHMPVPQGPPQPGRTKPSNKGFAYVDFATEEALEKAIAMSETLVSGRKVLIKDAKSFEGRPAQATATVNALAGIPDSSEGAAAEGKTTKIGPNGKPVMPPSKRVFVGNLNFDVTRDDLETHFSQAGELEDVFMATFQDTGKCKGYAWVRFANLEAAEAAVRGFIWKIDDDDDDEDAEKSESEAEEEQVEKATAANSDSEDDQDNEQTNTTTRTREKRTKKPKKQNKRKWFINRLHGRPLRCEFAEDASTRYKKRFGKERPTSTDSPSSSYNAATAITEVDGGAERQQEKRSRPKGDKDERQEMRRKKFDARKIRPGNALANAPRASAAIVEAAGKKTSFDD